MLKPAKNKNHEEWEIRDALNTLTRAQEISKDPKLMELVKKEAEKQKKATEEILRKDK
jgi:hypothetical protein